jgi:hypothetical protein
MHDCNYSIVDIMPVGNADLYIVLAGCSSYFRASHIEYAIEHKAIALGAFLDIEGAFDRTSFDNKTGC